MFAYRVDEATPGQLAAEDPYGGHGVFLPMPGASSARIIQEMEGVFGGILPASVWPDKGAWVDTRMMQATPGYVLALWEERRVRPPA